MESNFIEICLETIRIIRRVDQLDQIDAVEKQLSTQAASVNWTDPERWRDQLDLNPDSKPGSFLMKKVGRADKSQKFNHCPILGLMNFIYSVEHERADLCKNFRSQKSIEGEEILKEIGRNFDEYAIWCSTKFPKLIPTIKKAIPNIVGSIVWDNYSNRKEYPNIKAHLNKIKSLSNFDLTLRQRYHLDKDPKKITERF